MNFIPLNVSLDEACIKDFIRRYHFDEKDKNEVLKLYRQVKPRIHTAFHYVTGNDKNSFCKENAEDVVILVTLGQAFDEFQESFLSKGDIHRAYMLDCIGLELLWAAYDEVDKEINNRTGKYVGNYTFAGEDTLPITEIPRLMGILGQKLVTYNSAFALTPKKSVVMVAPLLDEKMEKNARCSSCSNKECTLRAAG
nr:hypothetical protein [uncultured Butyrivibrio sp.]